MKDIELAKNYLLEKDKSLVIVKDGRIVFEDKEKGIKPLLKALEERQELISGGALADRVIGKAGAMLSIKAGINRIYSEVISESAINMLVDKGIDTQYRVKVPVILNRDKSGLCPIENIAKNHTKVEGLINDIKVFLKL